MLSLDYAKDTKEPLKLIDATPDKYYPLRILRAYRESCNYRWGDGTGALNVTNPLFHLMNEHCVERARILDSAIDILEREVK